MPTDFGYFHAFNYTIFVGCHMNSCTCTTAWLPINWHAVQYLMVAIQQVLHIWHSGTVTSHTHTWKYRGIASFKISSSPPHLELPQEFLETVYSEVWLTWNILYIHITQLAIVYNCLWLSHEHLSLHMANRLHDCHLAWTIFVNSLQYKRPWLPLFNSLQKLMVATTASIVTSKVTAHLAIVCRLWWLPPVSEVTGPVPAHLAIVCSLWWLPPVSIIFFNHLFPLYKNKCILYK